MSPDKGLDLFLARLSRRTRSTSNGSTSISSALPSDVRRARTPVKDVMNPSNMMDEATSVSPLGSIHWMIAYRV
jgi:hypothetical protein